MPFKSDKQRAFMFAKHPDIAKKWAAKYGTAPKPKQDNGLANYLDGKKKR